MPITKFILESKVQINAVRKVLNIGVCCYSVALNINFFIKGDFQDTKIGKKCQSENSQPINDQCSPSYRNQSIDLQFKSIDWFLYDGEHKSLMC